MNAPKWKNVKWCKQISKCWAQRTERNESEKAENKNDVEEMKKSITKIKTTCDVIEKQLPLVIANNSSSRFSMRKSSLFLNIVFIFSGLSFFFGPGSGFEMVSGCVEQNENDKIMLHTHAMWIARSTIDYGNYYHRWTCECGFSSEWVVASMLHK